MSGIVGYSTPKSESWNLDECQGRPYYQNGADFAYQDDISSHADPVEMISCDIDRSPMIRLESQLAASRAGSVAMLTRRDEMSVRPSFFTSPLVNAPLDSTLSFNELMPAFATEITFADGQLLASCARYNLRVMNFNDNISCFSANVSAYKRGLGILGFDAANVAVEHDVSRRGTDSFGGINSDFWSYSPTHQEDFMLSCALLPELIAIPESQLKRAHIQEPISRRTSEAILLSGSGSQYMGGSKSTVQGGQSSASLAMKDATLFCEEPFPMNLNMPEDQDPKRESSSWLQKYLLRGQWGLRSVDMRQVTENRKRLFEGSPPVARDGAFISRTPTYSMTRADFLSTMVSGGTLSSSVNLNQVYDETVANGKSERFLTLGAIWDYLIAKAELNCIDHEKVDIQRVMQGLRGHEVSHGYGPAYLQTLVDAAWENTPLRV